MQKNEAKNKVTEKTIKLINLWKTSTLLKKITSN